MSSNRQPLWQRRLHEAQQILHRADNEGDMERIRAMLLDSIKELQAAHADICGITNQHVDMSLIRSAGY